MGSPVTLSGFNNIDFGSVLNALMQQERIPVTQLETQQTALQGPADRVRHVRDQARVRSKAPPRT